MRYFLRFITLFFVLHFPLLKGQNVIFNENCNTLGSWTNTGGIYPGNMPGYNWSAVVPIIPAADHTGGGGGVFYVNGNSAYLQAGAGRYILYRLESPIINLAGQTNIRLEFWMQMRSEVGNWDGGFVEWSNNGGQTWQLITNTHLCVPYDGNMTQNPSSTPFYPFLQPAWWNPRWNWTRVVANVTPLGLTANCKFRFTFHSDEAANDQGWALDDIRIVAPATMQAAGNGITIVHNAPPALPPGTDFGPNPVGSNTVHTFYIRNIGTGPLTLTGNPPVTISGSTAFTVVNQPNPTVIQPGDSVAVQVAFNPLVAGTFNGTINIPHSDTYSACNIPNPYLIPIRGSAVNFPPFTQAIPDTILCPGGPPIVIPFTVADLEQPVSAITATATSSNQGLVPNANIQITGQPGANRQLTITPVAGVQGTALISLTLNDGQNVNFDSTFTFNVIIGDPIPPVALCQNVSVQLDPVTLSASIQIGQIDAGSTDNCGITGLALSTLQFTCADAPQSQTILSVTDLGGNVSQCTATVTVQAPPLVANFTTSQFNGNVNISCAGANDGNIQVQASGGCPGYVYQWMQLPNNNTNNAGNLPANTYDVVVTDQAGQVINLQIPLIEPAAMVNQTFGVSPSCAGRMDGRVLLAAAGGVQPFVFQPSQQLSNLAPGFYQTTITDANGCQVDSLILLQDRDTIQVFGNRLFQVLCGESFTPNLAVQGGISPYQFQWNYPQWLSCDTCLMPVFTPDRNLEFTLVVTDSAGCNGYFSIETKVECNIFIPSAFTPNGDGLNEFFTAIVAGYTQFSLVVYDRWGNAVYETDSPAKGWDGLDPQGKPAQNDVYVYHAYVEMANGDLHDLRGMVTLVR